MPGILVFTVGLGGDSKKQKSLAEALAYAVEHSDPQKVFFICTDESKSTLELNPDGICDKYEKEIIILKEPDNIQDIFNVLFPKFKEMRSVYGKEKIIINYTSGTKSMSAGTVLAAVLSGFDNLQVIHGARENGIVKSGTEVITEFKTAFVNPGFVLKEANAFFKEGMYDACLQVLERIDEDKEFAEIVNKLKQLAQAYSCWDRFDHKKALEKLKGLKFGKEEIDEGINRNKQFLGEMSSSNEIERYEYRIADLLNNAKRRAREGKYDDAVARLYRAIEGIAEYKLLKNGIDLNNVNQENLSNALNDSSKASWLNKIEDGKLKIGLKDKFQLLRDINDRFSEVYFNDKELQILLSKRNYSILAHGWETISKDDYDKLYNKIESIAKTILKDIKDYMKRSELIISGNII